MTIVFDAASEENGAGIASPFTWTHTTTTSASERFMLVAVIGDNTTVTISGITYAGSALTQIVRVQNVLFAELWYLKNPATGANTISVSSSGSVHFTGLALTYTGVDQNNPLGTYQTTTAGGADTTITAILTAEIGQVVADLVAENDNGTEVAPPTPSGAQTERVRDWSNSGSSTFRTQGAMSEQGGAPSVTMQWTKTAGRSAALIAVPLRAASSGRRRLVQYQENAYLSRLAGQPQILDSQGRHVPVEQLEFDQWIRQDGPFLPTSFRFASLIQDPAVAYIEGLKRACWIVCCGGSGGTPDADRSWWGDDRRRVHGRSSPAADLRDAGHGLRSRADRADLLGPAGQAGAPRETGRRPAKEVGRGDRYL
jgi:hypothetical protein